jgi:hypothetical protein
MTRLAIPSQRDDPFRTRRRSISDRASHDLPTHPPQRGAQVYWPTLCRQPRFDTEVFFDRARSMRWSISLLLPSLKAAFVVIVIQIGTSRPLFPGLDAVSRFARGPFFSQFVG